LKSIFLFEKYVLLLNKTPIHLYDKYFWTLENLNIFGELTVAMLSMCSSLRYPGFSKATLPPAFEGTFLVLTSQAAASTTSTANTPKTAIPTATPTGQAPPINPEPAEKINHIVQLGGPCKQKMLVQVIF